MMMLCDTLGLGIFTVVGIQAAASVVTDNNTFFFVFVGVLTGVGGGVLRDIMAGETPYILVREIYACASIAGGIWGIDIDTPFRSYWIFLSPQSKIQR